MLGRALDISPDDVQVSVRDGLVTLRGTLTHQNDIPAAIGLTWRVDGVVGVVNRLTPYAGDGTPHPPGLGQARH